MYTIILMVQFISVLFLYHPFLFLYKMCHVNICVLTVFVSAPHIIPVEQQSDAVYGNNIMSDAECPKTGLSFGYWTKWMNINECVF